jgi:hypothetical protein
MLIIKTVSAVAEDPSIGRAEALRRSMVELIKHGAAEDAHPAMWAPFVLVGEGGVTPKTAPPTSPLPIRVKKPVTTPDWRTNVWRHSSCLRSARLRNPNTSHSSPELGAPWPSPRPWQGSWFACCRHYPVIHLGSSSGRAADAPNAKSRSRTAAIRS